MTRRRLFLCATAVLWAITAGTAVAHGSELTYTPPTAPPAPAAGPLLLRLVALTFVVLAACAGLVRWSRGSWRTTSAPADGTARLAHVAAVSLGRRCSLHLVRAGGRRVVLGVDAAGLKAMVLVPESFAAELDGERGA